MRKKSHNKKYTFPNPLASKEEKDSNSFGINVARAIESEWFNRANGAYNCRFFDQRDKFNLLRLYARGEQPISKYKDEFKFDGDLSYLNLDWTPVPIIPKFVDIIVNGMSERLYGVKAQATDKVANEIRGNYIESIKKEMAAKDFLMEAKNELGIDAFMHDPNSLPETDEELEVHMQLNYKQAIEIAEEEAITNVFSLNDYESIRKRVHYDLTVLGIGAAKNTFNKAEGIQLQYVDPADLIYSYSESPTFDNVYYYGEVKKMTLSEVDKIWGHNLEEGDLDRIADESAGWSANQGLSNTFTNREGDLQGHMVNVMYFTYKTSNTSTYKKKYKKDGKGFSMNKRTKDFNPTEEQSIGDNGEKLFDKVEKVYDVWYEGVKVLGTDIMLEWELAKNMVRPKGLIHKAMSPYSVTAPRIYQGRIESLVQRMIPFTDLIQISHLKLQQVISRLVPDGIYVDVDGLNEIDLGEGNSYNPMEALNLYFQTGSIIGRSTNYEGEYNHGKVPIEQLNSSNGGGKIQSLVSMYNHYLQMIRDVTGLNEARDASTPHSDTLVGVQKLAALNSNTATRHILEGALYITSTLAKGISYRVSDILEYSEHKEQFVNSIGKYNVALLDDIKKLHLHDFGIFIELQPDQVEKEKLEANIQQSLGRDQIHLEDAIDLREIKNIKLANQLLKIRRKAKAKADQEAQQAAMQSQAQSQAELSKSQTQDKMQILQAEYQGKAMVVQEELKSKQMMLQKEVEAKERLMMLEYKLQFPMKSMELENKKEIDTQKEDRKDKRQDRNNTQHSKMIEQRRADSAPVNFESNEDSLDGFDLAEFDPR